MEVIEHIYCGNLERRSGEGKKWKAREGKVHYMYSLFKAYLRPQVGYLGS